MNTKILLLFLSFIYGLVAFADNGTVDIVMKYDEPEKTHSFKDYTIHVRKEPVDNEQVRIIVTFGSECNDNLCLFGTAYSERELQKNTGIKYDKSFPGSRNRRQIDAYSDDNNNRISSVVIIYPKTSKQLFSQNQKYNVSVKYTLPLYVGKYKRKGLFRKNRLYLLGVETIILNITVEGVDEDYTRLKRQSDELLEELRTKVFCTNRNHRPTKEVQEEPYRKRKDDIISEIDDIYSKNKWLQSSHDYEKYKDIKEELKNVDFSEYERDCGNPANHVTKVEGQSRYAHHCKYCNYSLQQIYHLLDDYYKKIYSSSNRKEAKEAVIGDVNLLYQCCTDPRCKQHASSWKKDEYYKSKIQDRYNRISKF